MTDLPPTIEIVDPGRDQRYRSAIVRWASDPVGMFSLAVAMVILILVAAAPLVTIYGAQGLGEPDIMAKLKAPSAEHIMGTDPLGRDLWARLVFGGRVSLAMVATVLTIAIGIGATLGIIAGFVGGWIDEAIMRLTDVFLAFPALLLAIFVSALLGPGFFSCALAIGLSWWPWYARLARANALIVTQRPYVEAALVMGVARSRVMLRHVLPAIAGPLVVQATVDVGGIILTAAALSFLGLGVLPPTPDWGQMIGEGRVYFPDRWWIVTFPGLAIFLMALSFGLLGDSLRAVGGRESNAGGASR